jgi:uncharacterized protein (TIRG00374 family)
MMNNKLKLAVNIITLLAFGIVIYSSWPQIVQGINEMSGAKATIILLMIPLQMLNFYAIAELYRSYFKQTGETLSRKSMYRVALELNFINHIFPSGGVVGFSYLSLRLKQYGITASRSTLAQVMRFGLTFVSFLIILFIGMFLLSFGNGNDSNGVALFIGLSITFLTLFGVMAGGYIISSKSRINTFTAFLPRVLNKVLRPFRKGSNAIDISRLEKLFDGLHSDYVLIAKDWKKLKIPFFWSLVMNVTEVATVYLAYVALGHLVNPGAVILAYAVASFAGLVSILPGGIGVYEALMTGTLAGAGVPKALALSATLIYRILTMVVFLPIGFIYYQIALRKGEAESPSRATARPHIVSK